MPTMALESASGRRCVRSASVQNAGKLSAFHGEYQLGRSPSSVLLQPTGRKTDVSKLGQPESRRFAEKTRLFSCSSCSARFAAASTSPNEQSSGFTLHKYLRGRDDYAFHFCLALGALRQV